MYNLHTNTHTYIYIYIYIYPHTHTHTYTQGMLSMCAGVFFKGHLANVNHVPIAIGLHTYIHTYA